LQRKEVALRQKEVALEQRLTALAQAEVEKLKLQQTPGTSPIVLRMESGLLGAAQQTSAQMGKDHERHSAANVVLQAIPLLLVDVLQREW
jgi:hypothetical protein